MPTNEKAPKRSNASRPGNVPTDAPLSYQTGPTLQEAEEALYCIPANCPEAEWSKVGMALSSEFPGPEGFTLFDTWSQGSPDQYDRADLKSRWNSWKRGKGIGIATLFGIAKEHGYRPQPRAPLTPAELAELNRNRAKREHQRAEAERVRTTDANFAAMRAMSIENNAQEAPPDHGYLKRQRIKPHGLHVFKGNLEIAGMPLDGCLIVPVRTIDGHIRSLQFIHPDRPGAEGKRNLPKGDMAGNFWLLGEFTDTGPVYLTEGPATAASVHEATEGACVLCTFSAGNLEPVARQVRARHPDARIILVPDHDRTGLDAAHRAARAVNGLIVPAPQPPIAGGDHGL